MGFLFKKLIILLRMCYFIIMLFILDLFFILDFEIPEFTKKLYFYLPD